MGDSKDLVVIDTVGEPVGCEHEPRQFGKHWTCVRCGERCGAPRAHEPKQFGPHWTCVKCGERCAAPGGARPPVSDTSPAPAPAAVPTPTEDEDQDEPGLLDGLGWDASDERIAASKKEALALLDRHKAKNEKRRAESSGGAQEHIDNIEAVGSLAWEFLSK